MIRSHSRRVESVFLEAVELPFDEQEVFVHESLRGEPGLAGQVLALLVADRANAGGDLTSPLLSLEEQTPVSLGHFRINRLLGLGGMGAVYEASQDRPRRTVAIKVIRTGLATPRVLRRFELESDALAALQHPGIVRLYEAGTATALYADGTKAPRPYLAMELAHGQDILSFASSRTLPVRSRIRLLMQVCSAVEHAHQHGIIHRDLKPANILVDEAGVPKILDFGIARLASPGGRPSLTGDGQHVGTAPYMSPEQLRPGTQADTRADVFSLGVILGELIAFRRDDPSPRGRLTSATAPIGPDKKLLPDAIAIAAMASDPDPDRRYQSVGALAADLDRCLSHEPITARRLSGIDIAIRFVARHKVLAASVTLAVSALIAGAGVASWEAAIATREAARANAALARAALAQKTADATSEFLTRMLTSADPQELGREVLLRDVLDHATRDASVWKADPLAEALAREAIGRTYYALGDFQPAIEHLQRSHQLRVEQLGEDDALTLSVDVHLAAALNTMGEIDRAAPIYQRIYDVRLASLGAADELTIGAECGLAGVRVSQQRFADAETLYRDAIAQWARAGLEPAQTSLGARSSLAWLLYRLGRHAESDAIYQPTLPQEIAILGPDASETLQTMLGSAANLIALGRRAEALPLYQRVRESREKHLGPQHPETLGVLHDLALLHLSSGHPDEAEPLLRRVLAGAEATLGPSHRNTLKTRTNIAACALAGGRPEEAAAQLEETLELQQKAFGADNVDVGDTCRMFAEVRIRLADDESAAALFTRSIDVFSKAVGEADWMVASLRSSRADCLTRLRRFDQAEADLRFAQERLAPVASAHARESQATLRRLIALYQAWGRPEQAKSWLVELERSGDAEAARRDQTDAATAE